MKKLQVIGWVALGALLIIQFIKPTLNQAAGVQANYIGTKHEVPANVKSVLDKACMDCHSNNTRYPWYASIQPVAWWLADHVKDGKKHLNFDEYTQRSLRYQYHKMEEIVEMVKEEEMPLPSYTWTHTDARLAYEERVAITGWAQSVMKNMEAQYPMDSLVKKLK
ncbi:MAG: heme-binding domain-containing protein [Bacteroidota bacterium]